MKKLCFHRRSFVKYEEFIARNILKTFTQSLLLSTLDKIHLEDHFPHENFMHRLISLPPPAHTPRNWIMYFHIHCVQKFLLYHMQLKSEFIAVLFCKNCTSKCYEIGILIEQINVYKSKSNLNLTHTLPFHSKNL